MPVHFIRNTCAHYGSSTMDKIMQGLQLMFTSNIRLLTWIFMMLSLADQLNKDMVRMCTHTKKKWTVHVSHYLLCLHIVLLIILHHL